MNLTALYCEDSAIRNAIASFEMETGARVTIQRNPFGVGMEFRAGKLGPFDTLPELRRAIIADRDEERLSRLYP